MKKFAMILSIVLNIVLIGLIGADKNKISTMEEVAVQKECDHAFVHNKYIIGNYEEKINGDIVVEFSDYSWAIINHETKEYVFQPACMGDWDMTFESFEDLKMAMETYFADAEVTIQEPEKIEQTIESKKLNPDNIYAIEKELAKLPDAVKKLLVENDVEITLQEGLLENYEEGVHTYGVYFWEENKIVMDADEYSIEMALIHEIGHALDDILCIETEKIWESYEDKEIKYENKHFHSELAEYVAQGVHEYYNETLEKNTTMYKELDIILGGIE